MRVTDIQSFQLSRNTNGRGRLVPSVIATSRSNHERKFKEAWLIHKREKAGKVFMNRDKGVDLSKLWLDLV